MNAYLLRYLPVIWMCCTGILLPMQMVAQQQDSSLNHLQLDEVYIMSKSEYSEAREQAIKAGVINVKENWDTPVTLSELINRSSGVRIRQAGGLGANTEISVNGFQGKSIRYFRDGIPLDYLREGFNLASVPVNALERIEIYKGVLPVNLGADALGGAVHMVSRTQRSRSLAASYEIASFNTHRLSLNGYYTDSARTWFIGSDLFVNYSDNDYKANVKVTDPQTRNQREERVRLFHNRYAGFYGEVYAGLTNRSWADELRFSLTAFQVNRQQNHPVLMTDPYGAVTSSQKSLVPTLRYKKSLLNNRLHIDQFLVANTILVGRTDTAGGVYDWYGNFTPVPNRIGESRQPALSSIRYANFTSRTNLEYRLTENHKIQYNQVVTHVRQQGSDPFGVKLEHTGKAVISIPATYRKWVSGLALESAFMDKKLSTQLMAKYFHYATSGLEGWQSIAVTENQLVQHQDHNWGIAFAAKYQLNQLSLIRFSAEMANRLPDQEEIFGDAIWVVPNFNLLPEKSMNLNLGYRYQAFNRSSIELNAFYRRTENLILLIPMQSPYAQFQNMRHVKGFGIEADGLWNLNKNFALTGNITMQDIRLFNVDIPSDRWQNDARLRNTPYFFGNAGLNFRIPKTFGSRDGLKLYLYYSYMREYYLETIPKRLEAPLIPVGATKPGLRSELIIPDQHLLSAGLNYNLSGEKIILGVEVKNLLDHDLYDNYRVQKAGRSWHFKINYRFL